MQGKPPSSPVLSHVPLLDEKAALFADRTSTGNANVTCECQFAWEIQRWMKADGTWWDVGIGFQLPVGFVLAVAPCWRG